MSARAKGLTTTIVGVDVGGTFTDLFWFDEAQRRFATAKAPSHRGDEAVGFIAGLQPTGRDRRIGLDRARHDRRHQRAAGAQGRAHRRDHDARLSRRAGNAPPRSAAHLGPLGRFHADRGPRHAPRGRRARAGGRDRAHERRSRRGPGRRAGAARQGRRGARDRLHQRLRQSRPTSAPPPTPPRDVWPNEHVTTSSEILPEIREFERASTTALNAYLQPIVGSYLEKLGDALESEAFAGQFHIVQSNGGVMSTATARRLPVRTALSGPAAGVIAAAAIARAAGYPDVITADLGGTSFDVSLIAGGASTLARADDDRFRPRHPHADDRDHHDRRRRRIDRSCRHRRIVAGRAGERGVAAGPGLLRPGRRAADPDRRQCRARPDQRRAADRRRASAARRRGRQGRDRRDMSARRLGLDAIDAAERDRPGRQRAHGRARSGWSRSSAATIPGASPSCRSAAAARCTRAR